MRAGCLEEKIKNFIQYRKRLVFLRSDFEEICADYDQVGRALKKLVQKGILIKVGYGLYAKSKKSLFSGKIIPRKDIQEIGKACLKRLNLKAYPSQSENNYNSGSSTQVPTGRVIAVSGRISRKIGYNGTYLAFEKIRRQSAKR